MGKILKIDREGTLKVYSTSGGYMYTITHSVVTAQLNSAEDKIVLIRVHGEAELWSADGRMIYPISRSARDVRWSGDDIVLYRTDGQVWLVNQTGNLIRNY